MKVLTPARFVLSAFLLALGAIAVAGPLDPPVGPISPSFKTLTEVEPRTPVQSLAASEAAVYVITQPGSYYLTANIVVPAGKNGIEIQADQVTLDLRGFSIEGAESSLTGILSGRNNITVRNGGVRWCEGGGIGLGADWGHTVEAVRVQGCGPFGISAGVRSKLINCRVSSCYVGFAASNASTLEFCEAYGNFTTGFEVAPTSTVRSCFANGNFGDGFHDGDHGTTFIDCVSSYNIGVGFNTQAYSTFSNCHAINSGGVGFSAATGATLTNCSATRGASHGFDVGQDSLVQDCNATENGGDGIRVTEASRVRRCSVSRSPNITASGIHVTGASNLIDDCSVVHSHRGVLIDVGGNKVMRTTCSANTTNWYVSAGNYCFVVVGSTSGAIVGNSGGTPSGATDPEANFSY